MMFVNLLNLPLLESLTSMLFLQLIVIYLKITSEYTEQALHPRHCKCMTVQ